jgi:hypothetical protein
LFGFSKSNCTINDLMKGRYFIMHLQGALFFRCTDDLSWLGHSVIMTVSTRNYQLSQQQSEILNKVTQSIL